MGVINIHFEGICTQVKLSEALHRTVLVHAENGKNILHHDIPPHLAFLQVDSLDTRGVSLDSLSSLSPQADGSWQLNGARLFISNAVDGRPQYQESTHDVPSLVQLTPDFGDLSKRVVLDENANAACHFDIRSGTFRGARPTDQSAWSTVLTIETTEDPILTIQDMSGDGAGTIALNSGATITVKNTGGKETGDAEFDFLLHYLTAERMPLDARVPPAVTATGCVDADGLGPSCSNSYFP